ncbi:MAG: beta-propeller fold lactonase family protein, partial [Bdellovibrionota bacterium]
MIFNFKKIHLHALSAILVLVLYLVISSCGKGDGYSNSGTTNFYNFVYFGSFGSSSINSYYLDSNGALIVAANAIATGGGTSNVNDFAATINGKFLYAANKASNNVSYYAVDQLTATSPGKITYTNVESTGTGVSSVAITPNGKFAYLTNSTALTNNI